MSQYDNLDSLILERLAVGPLSFVLLEVSMTISNETHKLGGATGRDPFRILDGRLQALRKQGRIHSERQKWHLTKQPEGKA